MTMARAFSNRRVQDPVDPPSESPRELQQPLVRRSATGAPAHDWMSEFAQEPSRSSPPDEPAVWVEVPHPRLTAPDHVPFRPFSVAGWIRSHRAAARTAALMLALGSAGLLGLAWWMQRDAEQPGATTQVVTRSSEPVASRPASQPQITPPPASPPTVFTSGAMAPSPGTSSSGTTPGPVTPERRAAAPDRATSTSTSTSARSSSPPARVPAPASRLTLPLGDVKTTPSPTPSAIAPPPKASGQPTPAGPPPSSALPPSTSSTVTTSRPPVDQAALVLTPPVREIAVAPPPAPAPPPPASSEARETAAVESLIEQYRRAFSTLNSGVSDFWPGVNARALDKAFNELESQNFDFDKCNVQLHGAQAEATCTGSATFVPKVGNKTPRTQSRQWSFRFVRTGNRWIIDTVQSR